ncbi:MAG: FKBP-type peptidyl-prolyl cis-trans isomerase [Candidatus Paceibacterota bacterium]
MNEDFKIEDVKVGEGVEAVKGSEITVHYVGTLDDGTKFDSSRDRGNPFSFVLGSGMVIQGWEQGFEGMKVGGVRKLTIPPYMGYGDRAIGSIPPNSTLHFEVELLGVK